MAVRSGAFYLFIFIYYFFFVLLVALLLCLHGGLCLACDQLFEEKGSWLLCFLLIGSICSVYRSCLQSNFNGSNIFGTIENCSRHG